MVGQKSNSSSLLNQLAKMKFLSFFSSIKILRKGFSLLEVVVSLALFSLILLVVFSFLTSINASQSKIKADSQTQDNAKRALDEMTYEIRGAKSIYSPTTTSSQLSLQTTHYLPADETDTFIDFYLC